LFKGRLTILTLSYDLEMRGFLKHGCKTLATQRVFAGQQDRDFAGGSHFQKDFYTTF
jgi:hypothetical protein